MGADDSARSTLHGLSRFVRVRGRLGMKLSPAVAQPNRNAFDKHPLAAFFHQPPGVGSPSAVGCQVELGASASAGALSGRKK